jgi:hypothetical protein
LYVPCIEILNFFLSTTFHLRSHHQLACSLSVHFFVSLSVQNKLNDDDGPHACSVHCHFVSTRFHFSSIHPTTFTSSVALHQSLVYTNFVHQETDQFSIIIFKGKFTLSQTGLFFSYIQSNALASA